MKSRFRYQSIFMYSTLQFAGHVEEYFAKYTRKLVVYVMMPRLKNRANLLRRYREGRLIEEKKVWSSGNLFLYYLSWYLHYLYFICKYFPPNEAFIVISGHPIAFLGMTVQKLLRRLTFAYWIGDFYPPVKWSLFLFEKIKKFYHDRVPFTYYLSDKINQKMNGKVLTQPHHRTVMWGVKRLKINKVPLKDKFNILFIGLVKEDQGLELLFSFLARHKEYSLKIIGICPDGLYQKYLAIIKKREIDEQVFFPNKFYSDTELENLAKTCHVGVAMYDTSPLSATFYTDPGKVKAYAELGLPVVMSETSAAAFYIRRFGCGEVINNDEKKLEEALLKIRRNYPRYLSGLENFRKYFYFETYYQRAFKALEKV
ncbi:MAG: hypothetical protein ACOY0S_03130 [Patescibacteria group bacterium]